MTAENQKPETKLKQLKAGSPVIYFDEFGRSHHALLSECWGERLGEVEGTCFADSEPSVNLLFISPDAARSDSYGRQIERRSSCCHVKYQGAWGNCWCLPEQFDEAKAKIQKAKDDHYRDTNEAN